VQGLAQLIKKVIVGILDWVMYTVLDEKQRRKLANLISDKQKEKLKSLTKSGKQRAKRQKLQQIKYHLYNLGFTSRALKELQRFYELEKDQHVKRLASWELALWYANKYNKKDARKAINYLEAAKIGEKNKTQLRQISIVEVECYGILGKRDEGKQLIHSMLNVEEHADLYLALANLEPSASKRLKWINKALEFYGLQTIELTEKEKKVPYDQITTKSSLAMKENGPMVSVILPAFNAETGIDTAIESILNQTWRHLELIIVDDCSTDHTVDVVKEYMKKDSRIRLFSTPKNSGPYVARNIALNEATGEFVTINDSDDWSHVEKIEKQANHLIANKKVMANTSEHARLTEELKLYRRGTPGKYIFSNMSSLMFRRAPVMNRIGYWDSVRFAADGEFKRRLIKTFGEDAIVDLKTGPLSLPRQTVASLTGSSSFGYNGFFMGVRKEYVESFTYFYEKANDLYHPYPMKERSYPVPEPMWPIHEEKIGDKKRHFDVVIATDFRANVDLAVKYINHKQSAGVKKIGLVQLNHYDLSMEDFIHPSIREKIDGDQIQMIVYGEKVITPELDIFDFEILEEWQKYIPMIEAEKINVIALPLQSERKEENPFFKIEASVIHLKEYFGDIGTWHPMNDVTRKLLEKYKSESNQKLIISDENWEID